MGCSVWSGAWLGLAVMAGGSWMFGLESVQAASRIRAVIRGRMGFSFGRGCFDAGGFAFEVQLSITEKGELAPKSWTLIKAYSGALCKLGSVCYRTLSFFNFKLQRSRL